MTSIQNHYNRIQEQIAATLERSGRSADDARLVGVSKFHPPEDMRAAFEAGLRIFGESRAQEAERKFSELSDIDAEWHLVGALQTNKVKKALSIFNLIHSVDSPRLIAALQVEAQKRDVQVHVLLQLNLSGEEAKRGADEAGIESLLEALRQADRVIPHGLMTLPPFEEDPELTRPYFRRLSQIGERYRDDLTKEGSRLELSMGMSHDFGVAIEEGATLVRIGTALFGERPGYH